MALYNPQRQINSQPQVQFQLCYVFSAVGSRRVLYAQSHHRDQRTNLCHSPLATMSWRRLTSPSRVNRKMNPGGWEGGGYKQWLLTSVLREICELLLFAVDLEKKWGQSMEFGALEEPLEWRILILFQIHFMVPAYSHVLCTVWHWCLQKVELIKDLLKRRQMQIHYSTE